MVFIKTVAHCLKSGAEIDSEPYGYFCFSISSVFSLFLCISSQGWVGINLNSGREDFKAEFRHGNKAA